MTKHAKSSNYLQAIDLPKTMAVEIPLPLLEAFGSIESSFFELCINSGQQVLQAMMEQDREDLCGPRWIAILTLFRKSGQVDHAACASSISSNFAGLMFPIDLEELRLTSLRRDDDEADDELAHDTAGGSSLPDSRGRSRF